MSTYRVAVGHDVVLGSLVDVTPQPSTEGIKTVRRTYAADGTVHEDGKYIELDFNVLGNVAMYQSVLTAFGVKDVLTEDVTVYIRNEVFDWVRMNGTAVRPEVGQDVQWRRYFPRNITILVKNLVASS